MPADGVYRPITNGKLAASPGDGFPISGCVPPAATDAGVDAGTTGADAGSVALGAGTLDPDAGTTSLHGGVMDVDAGAAASPGSWGCSAAPAGRSGPWAPLAFGLTLLGLVGSRARRRTRR